MSISGSCALLAQSGRPGTAGELDRAGFAIYDVSLFGGFSSTTGPGFDQATSSLLPDSTFNSYSGGISTSVGWRSRKALLSHFYVRYSPAYYYQSSSGGFLRSHFSPQHTLDLSWDKKLGSKWTAAFSLSGSLANFDQFLLLPTTAQGVSLLPGTATQLFGSAQGASALVTPQQSLYYGGRILSAAGQTSLGYAVSNRLNISLGLGASRMQHIANNQAVNSGPFLLQQSTYLTGNLSLSYQITPRTDFYATAGYNRTVSSLITIPSTSLMFGLGRTITQRLVVHGLIGAGYILPYHGASFQRTQWQASGGLSYRALRHTFFGFFNRSVANSFGVGAGATLDASGGWSWSPQRRSWGLNAGVQDTFLQGYTLGRNGYNTNVGLYRVLGRRGNVSLNYGYGSYSSAVTTLGTAPSNIPLHYASHSVRISIGFSPYLGYPDGSRGIDSAP
jgi:hypothetical protein